MGYYITQHGSQVTILRKDFDAALEAMKAARKALGPERDWVWCSDISACTTLAEALVACNYEPVFNDDGIMNLTFLGEKLGDDEEMFKVLAPYIQDGSFITFSGEEGDVWRWRFEQGSLYTSEMTGPDVANLLSRENRVSISLDVLDDEGYVVDATTADLEAEAVQDIVAQAISVVKEARKGCSDQLLQDIAELREALESHNLLDPVED